MPRDNRQLAKVHARRASARAAVARSGDAGRLALIAGPGLLLALGGALLGGALGVVGGLAV
ncbi:hypothetical protein [Yunchengibacter salinarum]|uniref:hypothetical protein n=1 Tax=Yunchengibacter salinarum TaxID=3133399 RepID=UPI0035B66F31